MAANNEFSLIPRDNESTKDTSPSRPESQTGFETRHLDTTKPSDAQAARKDSHVSIPDHLVSSSSCTAGLNAMRQQSHRRPTDELKEAIESKGEAMRKKALEIAAGSEPESSMRSGKSVESLPWITPSFSPVGAASVSDGRAVVGSDDALSTAPLSDTAGLKGYADREKKAEANVFTMLRGRKIPESSPSSTDDEPATTVAIHGDEGLVYPDQSTITRKWPKPPKRAVIRDANGSAFHEHMNVEHPFVVPSDAAAHMAEPRQRQEVTKPGPEYALVASMPNSPVSEDAREREPPFGLRWVTSKVGSCMLQGLFCSSVGHGGRILGGLSSTSVVRCVWLDVRCGRWRRYSGVGRKEMVTDRGERETLTGRYQTAANMSGAVRCKLEYLREGYGASAPSGLIAPRACQYITSCSVTSCTST
ncbi:hypothetical protein P153DRAFT_409503 [Dothidotthia symphoricarpi CBS 119687]|uniref:Uncharacterized protein n=1 Tax=Dothidotthia symphoricarpi CBS 119687 TaxID=1392245 RepID=A0A6A6AQ95_9PLEO|nr:uncharacterized protein P153DRAFT_409503 [Dothidotthia symphoricarpi CBS 119687]KAF2134099.1 hypothetical protein P153DRAFT_409503 [Dothidotthia symphoricarpi CBS 119687]